MGKGKEASRRKWKEKKKVEKDKSYQAKCSVCAVFCA
jgi:hypothetical protein